MPTYRITGPDGSTYEVNAPDGATEQDAIAYVQAGNVPKMADDANQAPVGNDAGPLNAFAYSMGGLPFNRKAGSAIAAGYAKLGGVDDTFSNLYNQAEADAEATAQANPKANLAGNVSSILSTLPLASTATAGEAYNAVTKALPVVGKYITPIADTGVRATTGLRGLLNATPEALAKVGSFAGSSSIAGYTPGAAIGRGAVQLGRGAIASLPAGIAYGAGEAPTGDEVSGAITGAATGAGLAGILGIAAPAVKAAVIRPVTAVAGNVRDRISPRVSGILGDISDTAVDKVRNRLELQYPNPLPEQGAMYPTPRDAAFSSILNSDAGIVEGGGTQVQRLARGAAQFPSGDEVIRNYVGERVAGVPERVKDNLSLLSGNNDLYGSIEQTYAQGMAKSAPLYEAAFAQTPVSTPGIDRIVENKNMKSGIARGIDIIKNEADARNEPFNLQDFAIKGFDEAGEPVIEGVPTMRLLDAGKRGLDAQIADETNAITGRVTDRGRSLVELKKSLLNQVDSVNPAYKDARAASGDYLQMAQAGRDGYDFVSKNSKDISRTFAKQSPSEQEIYKTGMVRRVFDDIEGKADGRNVVDVLAGSPERRQKLEAVMKPEEYKGLLTKLQQEQELYRFRNSLGNSNTASKQIDAAEFADRGADIGTKVAKNGILPTLFSEGANVIARPFTGLSDRTAGDVARLVVERDPVKKAQILELLARQSNLPQGGILPTIGKQKSNIFGILGGNNAN